MNITLTPRWRGSRIYFHVHRWRPCFSRFANAISIWLFFFGVNVYYGKRQTTKKG